MPKNKIIIALGALIALLPILGFPHVWESAFEVIAGLSIVLVSVLTTIDKRITQRLKAQQRQRRKTDPAHSMTAEEAENLRRRMTDFYPKTGVPGRRAVDINPKAAVIGRRATDVVIDPIEESEI